jgi:hypothetical protein
MYQQPIEAVMPTRMQLCYVSTSPADRGIISKCPIPVMFTPGHTQWFTLPPSLKVEWRNHYWSGHSVALTDGHSAVQKFLHLVAPTVVQTVHCWARHLADQMADCSAAREVGHIT